MAREENRKFSHSLEQAAILGICSVKKMACKGGGGVGDNYVLMFLNEKYQRTFYKFILDRGGGGRFA